MLTHLGDMPVETFVKDYWQKRPLLIKQCFPRFACPFDENDLAGLALEEAVESRIVFEKRQGKPWQLERGPFRDKQLRKLPEAGWTLLIQGLDQWMPEMADLLDQFRFLPGWRLDDIMASFAPPGGSVGPHYDHYDVFLIQAMGRRRWQIGPVCNEQSPRVKGTPLRILDGFPVDQEWELEPGDVLYLPPAIAHHGVALENGITLSVGFRSPTQAELLSSFADYWIPQIDAPAFHTDYAALGRHTGRIPPEILKDFKDSLFRLLDNPSEMHSWMGRFLSQPKSDVVVEAPLEESLPDDAILIQALRDEPTQARWNDGSRYLYQCYEGLDGGAHLELFVDGQGFRLPADAQSFVEQLCQSNILPDTLLAEAVCRADLAAVVVKLIRGGSLRVEHSDDAP